VGRRCSGGDLAGACGGYSSKVFTMANAARCR
jgi:hypothetical protein